MKKMLSIILAIVLCWTLNACGSGSSNSNTANSNVIINGEVYTLDEFEDIAENNSFKFSKYVGKYAAVTGKITEIETGWISSNLNHSFDVSITIEDKWCFEVSRNNPMLDRIDIGDVVTVTGVISTELYGKVYSYGNATIKIN
jgi:hypothetical protein